MKNESKENKQAQCGWWLVLLAAGLTNTALALSQAPLDPNQIVRQKITGERDCAKEDLQFALLAQTSGHLKSEPPLMQNCRAVALSWLPSAKIVQVRGVRNRDVFMSLTFVQINEKSPVRLISALGGLVAPRDLENDEANKAAFNELLRASSYLPDEDKMFDIGALYLFMVGHPPDESPKTLRETMMVNDMMGSTSRKRRWTTVTVHQRTSMFGNPSSEWMLKFHNEGVHLKLVSVAPEFPPE